MHDKAFRNKAFEPPKPFPELPKSSQERSRNTEDDAEKGHDPLRVKEMDFCLREQNEVENWADEITNLCRQWRYGVAVDIYVEAKVARSKATRRYGDMHFEAKLYHPDHKNGPRKHKILG